MMLQTMSFGMSRLLEGAPAWRASGVESQRRPETHRVGRGLVPTEHVGEQLGERDRRVVLVARADDLRADRFGLNAPRSAELAQVLGCQQRDGGVVGPHALGPVGESAAAT